MVSYNIRGLEHSINDLGEALKGKSAREAIDSILPTQELTEPAAQARKDLYRTRSWLGEDEQIPPHLEESDALELATGLVGSYEGLPVGSLCIRRDPLRIPGTGEEYPQATVFVKHREETLVPAGQEVGYNGVFNFYTEQAQPDLRVMAPTVRLLRHKEQAIMRFDYVAHYGFDVGAMHAPLESRHTKRVLCDEIQRVVGDAPVVQIQDDNGAVNGICTGYSINPSNTRRMYESVLGYLDPLFKGGIGGTLLNMMGYDPKIYKEE